MAAPIEQFHAYSFATHRQYGACFELCETYLSWLGDNGIEGLGEAVEAFGSIAAAAKAYQFQLARAMARKRALPMEPLERMAELWSRGMESLLGRMR